MRLRQDRQIARPLVREMVRDEEDGYLMFRYVPELVERSVMAYLESTPPRGAVKVSMKRSQS